MQEWAGRGDRSGFRQEYLLEDLRLESRGEADSASPCLCRELDEDGEKKVFTAVKIVLVWCSFAESAA